MIEIPLQAYCRLLSGPYVGVTVYRGASLIRKGPHHRTAIRAQIRSSYCRVLRDGNFFEATVLLDPRDPLLHSERPQGFAADPDYWKG